MKKKGLLVVFLVLVLLSSTLSAKAIGINVGGTALYNVKAGEISGTSGFADIKNYNFGADVRVKLLVFNITAMGLYNGKTTIEDVNMQEISGLVTAGLAFDLVDTIRIGVGLGPRLRALTSDWKTWKVMQGTETVTANNFQDVFLNAPMTYRATVDFLLGGIALGVSYQVDSTYTFKDWKNVKKLTDIDLTSGKFGASVMFNI
ncbi:MAG: hypothetical protein WCR02_08455 [Sphaerochaetaceae bacterium]